jgi:16S rRNA (cytidine1402-2'-O)-methyltransferase
VRLCAARGIPVTSVPGCCAGVTALTLSGLPTGRFTFEGFLPSGKKERRAALEELTGEARTMVFHEAPHRLRQTLADMVELLGDRPAALCRELTKLHEDTVRTTLAQAAAFYRDNEPRGEYVLVIAGREKQNLPALTLEEGAARVLALRDGGMKLKEAVRRVADDTGLPRNALYDTALKA